MTDYTPWVAQADGPGRFAIRHYKPDGGVMRIATVLETHVANHPDEKSQEHAELIASAPRLKEERDELLAALKDFVARYPINIGARKARELIERIDRE